MSDLFKDLRNNTAVCLKNKKLSKQLLFRIDTIKKYKQNGSQIKKE